MVADQLTAMLEEDDELDWLRCQAKCIGPHINRQQEIRLVL